MSAGATAEQDRVGRLLDQVLGTPPRERGRVDRLLDQVVPQADPVEPLSTMQLGVRMAQEFELCRPDPDRPILNELGITHLAKQKAYTLSGGEKRRLEITRALVTDPQFILMDEPFSGIDPITVFEAQEMIRELRKRGMGILLTDHNVRETLEITDRAYIMAEGRVLIAGTAHDLITDTRAREIYLGEKFRL